MARNSGGMFGKLVLLGLGAVIGAAMTQKSAESNGTSQTSNLKENVKKGLDRFNEQSGGMVDKVKPGVSKAVDTVKDAIDKQKKMMDKEKDMLDKADKTLQDEVGDTSGSSSSSTSTDKSSSKSSGPGSRSSNTGSSSNVSPNTDKPTGGIYGGSTDYTESLKKDIEDDSTSNDSTFGK